MFSGLSGRKTVASAGEIVRALPIILVMSLAGCVDTPATSDSASGSAVKSALSEPPVRIVSRHPSATEVVLALGESRRLWARTNFDTDPRLFTLPSLGSSLTPTLEAVVGQRPDLIIVCASASHGGRSIERLRELKELVLTASIQTIHDIEWTRRLGDNFGIPNRADSVVIALGAQLDAIRARYAGCERVTAMYVLWPDPPQTAGPETYATEVMEVAGAVNVFADLNQQWSEVSMEEIVTRAPEFLILPSPEREPDLDHKELAKRPDWANVPTAGQGRILSVEGDLFNRPGSRVAEAAATLAALLDAGMQGRCGS